MSSPGLLLSPSSSSSSSFGGGDQTWPSSPPPPSVTYSATLQDEGEDGEARDRGALALSPAEVLARKRTAAKMDAAVRAKTLPYVESVMKIRASVAVLEGFRSTAGDQPSSEPRGVLFSQTLPLDSKEAFSVAAQKTSPAAVLSVSAAAPNKATRGTTATTANSDVISAPPQGAKSKGYTMTAQSLKRRYPRFTSNMAITDALIAEAETTPRSDVWLVNMMEQCYDEAVDATAKAVHGSDAKAGPKKRCGLSLGCLTSFAAVVNKYLGRIYGTADVRVRVCVEFLLGIERSLRRGDPLDNDYDPPEGRVFNCYRSVIFSKFLSEEWDLGFVALYLHMRDLMQTHFCIKFKDFTALPLAATEKIMSHSAKLRTIAQNQTKTLAMTMSNPGGKATHTDMSKTKNPATTKGSSSPGPAAAAAKLPRSGSAGNSRSMQVGGGGATARATGKAMKNIKTGGAERDLEAAADIDLDRVIPLELPSKLHFMPDTSFRDSPTLAFDTSSLDVCCERVLPKCPSKIRGFLAKHLVHSVRGLMGLTTSNNARQTTGDDLSHHSFLSESSIDMSEPILIPISTFLYEILEQWRRVPGEIREKYGAAGNSSVSLDKLNDAYADNCKAKADRLEEIRKTKILLNQSDVALVKLDKQIKRAERRWKENHELAADEDLKAIADLKAKRTEELANKNNIESILEFLEKNHAQELQRVDSLWDDALRVEASNQGVGSDAPPLKATVRAVGFAGGNFTLEWRNDASNYFIEAIKYRFGEEDAVQRSLMSSVHTEGASTIEQPPPAAEVSQVDDVEEETQFESPAVEQETELAEPETAELDDSVDMLAASMEVHAEERPPEVEESPIKAMQLLPQIEVDNRTIEANILAAKAFDGILNAAVSSEVDRQMEKHLARITALITHQTAEKVVSIAISTGLTSATNTLEALYQSELLRIAAERDASEREEALVTMATSTVERRLIMTLMLESIASETHLELERRAEKLTTLYMERFVDLAVVGTVERTITKRVNEVVEEAFTKTMEVCTETLYDEAAGFIIRDRVVELSDMAAHINHESAIDAMLDECMVELVEDEIQRRKDEELRQLRGVIDGIIANIEEDMIFYDPKWSPLDELPEKFLTRTTLRQVEALRERCLRSAQLLLQRRVFCGFRAATLGRRRVREVGKQMLTKLTWNDWLHVYNAKMHEKACAVSMQSIIRMFLAKRRFVAIKDHAEATDRAIGSLHAEWNAKKQRKAFDDMKWAVERRQHINYLNNHIELAIANDAFKRWRGLFYLRTTDRRKLKAAIAIQAQARGHQQRHQLDMRKAARLIRGRIRCYIARKRVRAKRLRMLRHTEVMTAYVGKRVYMRQMASMRKWKKLASVSIGARKLLHFWVHLSRRQAMDKMKYAVKVHKAMLSDAATTIQSAIRMFLSKRQVLNYYLFKRGLSRFQAIVRMRMARRVFNEILWTIRCANTIQRVYRGYIVRKSLNEKRVIDLHRAATANNYEKVLHYFRKYYHLVETLDLDGNNILHSAAYGAARRVIKLILKFELFKKNVLNFLGYSPLHMLITSNANDRDRVFPYLLEVGFDEEQSTADGKSCLLLAIYYNRSYIASKLLDDGALATSVDSYGLTCLQAACMNGLPKAFLHRLINEGLADPNYPGQYGLFPIHDVAGQGSLENLEYLLNEGEYVNTRGIDNGETPLMVACRAGHVDIVRYLLLQGCDAHAIDYSGQNAAHYAASSNQQAVFDPLREADVNFDVVDRNGDTPLHIAANQGATQALETLLGLGVQASIQNIKGNQPSHLAAAGNHADCLTILVRYDTHMGRMNYEHKTPLGVAKFHCAYEAQRVLQHYFKFVEVDGLRSQEGGVWWDREIDETASEWQLSIDKAGTRTFVNKFTGEIVDNPPVVSLETVLEANSDVELPLVQRAPVLVEADKITVHDYFKEHAEERAIINQTKRYGNMALVIEKWARRKIAFMRFKRKRKACYRFRRAAKIVTLAARLLVKVKQKRRLRGSILIQRRWRGYLVRRWIYYEGEYERMWYHRAGRRLAEMVYRAWRAYQHWRLKMVFRVAAHAPKSNREWQRILDSAGSVLRIFSSFEEYDYPGTKGMVKFYHNTFNGQFSFHKPPAWVKKDKEKLYEERCIRKMGFVPSHVKAVNMFSAIFRGFMARKQFELIRRGVNLSSTAEDQYLRDPDNDRNLFNYALHCHVNLLDYDRARRLYLEAMRRMDYKGPDIPHVLYAYGIFSFVTHELDEADCRELIARARIAEERKEKNFRQVTGGSAVHPMHYGKSFNLAKVGFFKRAATIATKAQRRECFHNYALCLHLVYDDFNGSFDAFMNAFTVDPIEPRLVANFECMVTYYYGSDPQKRQEVIKDRNARMASKATEAVNMELQQAETKVKKSKAAIKLQRFVRHHLHRKKRMRLLKSGAMTAAATARRRMTPPLALAAAAASTRNAAAAANASATYSRGSTAGSAYASSAPSTPYASRR